MNRLFLTKLHLLMAAFLFPAILMFLVTGALYTWGNTGKIVETRREVALAQPVDPGSEQALRAIALAELKTAGLAPPTGKSRLRQSGGSSTFEWTGSRRDVTVEPAADGSTAVVTIKEASLHRTMVQLHKAKAGVAFKVYATVLAIALFLLVVSGLVIGWQTPMLRRMTGLGSIAGLISFAGLFAIS